MEDIPAPWWIRLILVKLIRFLRKTNFGWYIVFSIKNRSHLGFVSRLHQKAIHDVRSLAVMQLKHSSDDLVISGLNNIVNSYRDTMADIIEIPAEEIHCTIKIFIKNKTIDPSKYKVYTLARSDDQEGYWHGRPLEYGSSHAHLVGKNSSFAALLGIHDGINDWSQNAYTCFIANKLDESEKYASSGKEWKNHYKSTAVFPIRFHHQNEQCPHVIGFVTFDSKKSVFGRKSIFDFKEPSDYYKEIKALSLFHAGGIMADSLYPSLIMYRTDQ